VYPVNLDPSSIFLFSLLHARHTFYYDCIYIYIYIEVVPTYLLYIIIFVICYYIFIVRRARVCRSLSVTVFTNMTARKPRTRCISAVIPTSVYRGNTVRFSPVTDFDKLRFSLSHPIQAAVRRAMVIYCTILRHGLLMMLYRRRRPELCITVADFFANFCYLF